MTCPKEAVEAVARALLREFNDTVRYEDLHETPKRDFDTRAAVLLDQIAPMLTARSEADKAAAVEALLTAKDYIDDSAAGLLQYRGRSMLVDMATEDKARIDAVLADIRDGHKT